ncbi:MAG: Calx-beta domain-containing protein, partial [Halobacteriales archaeon]|nr:Calx-beta domain-containing protein [Halobacteriales archaeon]
PATSGADSFTYQVCDTTSLCDTAVVSVIVDSSTTVVDQYAQSETTILGTTSGSLDDTLSADGVYEEITEAHSGGPPPNRQSFTEHRWTFNIQRGDSIDVTAVAYHTANSESDDFAFEYSTDDGLTFSPLFTVTDTGGPGVYTAALPEVISGEVIIRAVDTDQTPGNGNTDTLFVDYLVIQTTNPQAPLPTVTVTAPDDSAAESGDTGIFLISRDDPTGPLTVDFTLGGTADEVDDFTALGTSVTFADGQSDVTLTVEPVDDLVSEGDESVELSLAAGTTYQRGADSVATVFIIDDDVLGSEARALSETTESGSVVSGDYTSTHFANDGELEVIEEELYAGNKRSRLEHTWTFDVSSGTSVTFHLLAGHEGSETFTFSYSTDGGGSWTAI